MTSASVVFCSLVAIAFAGGFGTPAFARIVAADAFSATLPLLGVLIAARFTLRRFPAREALVHRVHAAAQGLLAGMAFGWWWVEPHAAITALSAGSLAAMFFEALACALVAFVLALVAERCADRDVAREVFLGSFVFFLLGGGRLYRAFDHVEAGTRLYALVGISAATLAIALLLYLLLRGRARFAAAVPALAPAFAVLALYAAPQKEGQAATASTRDSVIVVLVDTLRADVADGGLRGQGVAMPELARIAKDGIRFTQAVSPAPWTLPATVSLLSGWNPHRHGYGTSVSEWQVLAGDPAALYLAPSLRDAGYLTASFVHNPYLRPWFGFAKGFYTMRPYHGRAIDGMSLALSWIGDHPQTATFTLLHLMDPHWPYDAPPGFGEERRDCPKCDSLFDAQFGHSSPELREEIERRYVAEVRYTDALLGRFHGALLASGVLERSWLVITSDHGEEFWEHGNFLHGHALYDELLRVPLVILPPKSFETAARGSRVDAQVRLEDVAATILEVTGLDTAQARDGQSLLAWLRGDAKESFYRTSIGGYVKSPKDLSWSVRQPPWKAIHHARSLRSELFDLRKDAGEQRDLRSERTFTAAQQGQVEHVLGLLSLAPQAQGLTIERKFASTKAARPEADAKGQLESLGYLQ